MDFCKFSAVVKKWQETLRLKLREHFYTVRVSEPWHRLPSEAVDYCIVLSTALRILKIWTQFWANSSRCPCLNRGLDLLTSRGSFQSLSFSDSPNVFLNNIGVFKISLHSVYILRIQSTLKIR